MYTCIYCTIIVRTFTLHQTLKVFIIYSPNVVNTGNGELSGASDRYDC